MSESIRLTLADIHRRTHRTTATRIFYVLRRWPLIPILIIVTLVTCAVFAESISPRLPNRQDLRDRTAAPFWYAQCVATKSPISTIAAEAASTSSAPTRWGEMCYGDWLRDRWDTRLRQIL